MTYKKDDLTAEYVRSILDYDPATGEFRWIVQRGQRGKIGAFAGTSNSAGYILIQINGVKYFAHRLAWLFMMGVWPSDQLDHISGIRNDNRFENIRDCNQSENNCNRCLQINNTSGRKGVSWAKHANKWQAYIRINGKRIHLGLFDTVEAAHATYIKSAEKHFGEFARAA